MIIDGQRGILSGLVPHRSVSCHQETGGERQDPVSYQQPHTAVSFIHVNNDGPAFFAIRTEKALAPKERSNFIGAMLFNDLSKYSFGYAFLGGGSPTILIGQIGKKHKRLSGEDLLTIVSKLRAIATGVGINITHVRMETLASLPEDWQRAPLQSTTMRYTRDSLPRKVRSR